jgi:predicted Zn finger-like uncharacterized protein
MFTVCPKCALTLVVSAADLRVAQGYVRCGRCSNVFNAIVGLSDDRQKAAAKAAMNAPQRQAPAAAPPPPPPPRQPEPEIEIETEAEDTATTGENEALYAEPEPLDVLPESALEFDPDSADVSEVFVAPAGQSDDERSGTFETIVLRADEEEALGQVEAGEPEEEEEEEAPEEPPEDEYVDHELRSLAARIDAEAAAAPQAPRAAPSRPGAGQQPPPRFVSESEQGPAARAAAAQTVAARQSARAAAAAVAESLSPPPKAPPDAMTYVWPAAAVFALLLLLVQAIHHYRHDLATDPRFNRPLTSLYAKLGVPIVPRWDLTSYDVRQLGASTGADTRGRLLVRASLKNSAAHSLPLPLLRVIVQDRYGNRIASRDVAPRAYVPGAVPESALLGPGQRIDAEMAFVDPGQQAVGFEIDACLPSPEGAITCANDIIAAR